jgi:hypothetical protein
VLLVFTRFQIEILDPSKVNFYEVVLQNRAIIIVAMLSRGFQALRRVCTKAGSSGRNAPTKVINRKLIQILFKLIIIIGIEYKINSCANN